MVKSFSFSAPTMAKSMVEKEIEGLSEEEKQRILDDLYGEGTSRVVDNPELCENALLKMQVQLDAMPDEAKQQYLQAVQQCPTYVHDVSFRLQFLRCEMFDINKAAKRFVSHWENKVRLWGPERAFKRISANDFEAEDQKALEGGGIRVLPAKDRNGRGIIMVDRNYYDQRATHRTSMQRLNWYMHQIAAEDPDVQLNGLLYIASSPINTSTLAEEDRKLDNKNLVDVKEALPVRVVGIHHYLSSRLMEFVAPILNVLFGGDMRKRYKVHGGSLDRWLNELDGYGISADCLQVMHGGTLDFDYARWLKERRKTDT